MARVLALLVVWVLQGSLIVLLVNAEWLEHQSTLEQARIEEYLGAIRHEHIKERAWALYRSYVIDTGAVARSYERLLPDRTAPQHGMEELAPWFFEWLKHRLDAFWWLVFQAIYRVQVLVEWLPYWGVVVFVAAADGWFQRQVKRASAGYASADRYTLARGALLILGFLPFIYLSLPVSIPPVLVPVWGILFCAASAVFIANAQHEV
jgi:hypothetical protein